MARKKPVRIAVIGCGTISGIYMENLSKRFSIVELVGCSDLLPERSAKRADQFGIRQMTNAEIYADPENIYQVCLKTVKKSKAELIEMGNQSRMMIIEKATLQNMVDNFEKAILFADKIDNNRN